jgi:hypothetical protein
MGLFDLCAAAQSCYHGCVGWDLAGVPATHEIIRSDQCSAAHQVAVSLHPINDYVFRASYSPLKSSALSVCNLCFQKQ